MSLVCFKELLRCLGYLKKLQKISEILNRVLNFVSQQYFSTVLDTYTYCFSLLWEMQYLYINYRWVTLLRNPVGQQDKQMNATIHHLSSSVIYSVRKLHYSYHLCFSHLERLVYLRCELAHLSCLHVKT